MRAYLDLLRKIIEKGTPRKGRTKIGTLSLFGYQMRFRLAEGYPLLTTKSLHLKSIIHELLWFLEGSTNVRALQKNRVRIWDKWADERGDLGPVYGAQWRSWPVCDGSSIDQLAGAVDLLKKDPESRRILVSAWNTAQLAQMALPPCHCLFQFYAADGLLSCHVYQRSADVFLGVPFNIASYALLTMMVAQVVRLRPHELVYSFGDAHLYLNHLDQARLQLAREPRSLPRITIDKKVKDLFSFRYQDFVLSGYDPHPRIKAAVSI